MLNKISQENRHITVSLSFENEEVTKELVSPRTKRVLSEERQKIMDDLSLFYSLQSKQKQNDSSSFQTSMSFCH